MKCVILLFSIEFITVSVSASFISCNFIANNTKSIELVCTKANDSYHNDSDCFSLPFKNDPDGTNKLKVIELNAGTCNDTGFINSESYNSFRNLRKINIGNFKRYSNKRHRFIEK